MPTVLKLKIKPKNKIGNKIVNKPKNKIVNNPKNKIANKQKTEKIVLKSQSTLNDLTVVIPCHYKHLIHIPNVLQEYNKQTSLPYEIILVISEIPDEVNLDYLNNGLKYKFRVIKIKEKSFAGNNRKIGATNATTNIITFQDADDIPHIQRLEIIKYFFDKYPNVVHILHKYQQKKIDKKYNVKKIETKMADKVEKVGREGMHNGVSSIKKEIVDKVNWFETMYPSEDSHFNKEVYNKYKNTLKIMVPLYYYRMELSAGNPNTGLF